MGSWDKVSLSCLWPLEWWSSPRAQKAAAGRGQKDSEGHRPAPEVGRVDSVGRRSRDTKLPRGGGHPCWSAAGDRPGPGWSPYPHPASVCSSQSEAAAQPQHRPPPRLLLRGTAPTPARRRVQDCSLGGLSPGLSGVSGHVWHRIDAPKLAKKPTNLLAQPAMASASAGLRQMGHRHSQGAFNLRYSDTGVTPRPLLPPANLDLHVGVTGRAGPPRSKRPSTPRGGSSSSRPARSQASKRHEARGHAASSRHMPGAPCTSLFRLQPRRLGPHQPWTCAHPPGRLGASTDEHPTSQCPQPGSLHSEAGADETGLSKQLSRTPTPWVQASPQGSLPHRGGHSTEVT